jgi:hypothetical protein
MPHATSTCVVALEDYLAGMRISTSAWRRRPASGEGADSLIVKICVVPTSPLRPGRTPTILPLNRCGPARFVSAGPIGTMGRG